MAEATPSVPNFGAYDRGWKDCLTAMIPIIEHLPRGDAIAVLTRLRDNPPSKDSTT